MSSTTTTMSTTTGTAATATGSSCINVYQLPTTDAACAAPIAGNMTSAFDTCCKGNSPVKYDNDCGIYCLAQEQTVDKLSHCLQKESNNYAAVFCNDALNATATAAATTTHSTSTGTKTGTSASSTTTKNAAGGKTSVAGAGVLAMVFVSAVMGAFA